MTRLRPGRTRFARNGSLRIAYQIHRGWRRKPWLLMIHGLGFDHTGWDPVISQLGKNFRLILMDNRGCGASDGAGRLLTISDLAQDAVAVLDAAGVRRAHVLGASLGGMVAQELALRFPDRVHRLVLACTTPGWPTGFPLPTASLRLMARSRHLPAETVVRRHIENTLSVATVERQPELVERLIQHQRAHPVDRAGWSALNGASARYYGGTRQQHIQARTLVLQGCADRVVDPRNGVLLAQRIPNAELVAFPDLGHLFFWEQPAALTEPVSAFLT